MAKITLEHPETGDVRETSTARVAVELQAQYGYRVQKDLQAERKQEAEAAKAADDEKKAQKR